MAFQSQVGRFYAEGASGQAATPNQSIYTALGYVADGDVTVGAFVFPTATEGKASASASSGPVLGLVERVITQPIYQANEVATEQYTEGTNLTIAVKGDYYVKVTAQATVGQAVFASLTDGSIKTAAAGSSQEGFVETPWTVKSVLSSGSSGGLILISNWNVAVVSGGGDLSSYLPKAEAESTYRKKTDPIDLTSEVSGILPITNGGTGKATE